MAAPPTTTQKLLAEALGTAFLVASGPHQAETIRRALSVTVDGQQLFTAAEVTWNLLEPSAGVAAAEAPGAYWAERAARPWH